MEAWTSVASNDAYQSTAEEEEVAAKHLEQSFLQVLEGSLREVEPFALGVGVACSYTAAWVVEVNQAGRVVVDLAMVVAQVFVQVDINQVVEEVAGELA